MHQKGRLLFLCGKMAAGKSTLSKALAEREDAVLLVQDEFVERLFPNEIVDIASFVKSSNRIKEALTDLICSLLSRGTSVVLDFPGNTRNQRAWFRQLCERISSRPPPKSVLMSFDMNAPDHGLHPTAASAWAGAGERRR